MQMNDKKKIRYEKRVIAFVDILGFKEIVKNSEKDDSKLKIILDSLRFIKSKEKPSEWDLKLIDIEEDAQKKGVNKFDISKKTCCTCFSDSIVISIKIEKNNINELVSTLVANLSFIGAKLMIEGILLRGGITFGNLIHTEDGLIMGQALIDAYKLESNVAKYPRILLSKKLLGKLNYPLATKRDRYPYHQYINRFKDGCVGFHQMIYFQVIQSCIEMKESTLKEELRKIKLTILNGLDSNFEHPDIYRKFNWLKDQYNELIILTDGIKEPIMKLNEGIVGQNIHYSYTDDFYFSNKKK